MGSEICISDRLPDSEKSEFTDSLIKESVVDDLTFQEAFEKTGKHISISVSPLGKYQNSRLLNAITSPNVYIRSAVRASMSVPGFFPPVRLYAKCYDGMPRPYLPSQLWVDGSVASDLPAKRLSRLYGVNHFVASIANPVVAPFIADTKHKGRKGIRKLISHTGVDYVRESLAVLEKIVNRNPHNDNRQVVYLNHFINMLGQKYDNDINVVINLNDFKLRHVLAMYRDGDVELLIQAGAKTCWPKMQRVKDTTLISQTLDSLLESLSSRILGNSG